jgi:hypothetical protein
MTTTQIKRTGTNHVTGSTCSVVNATPGITDSANGFTYQDVGCTVTTTSTSGLSVSSVTNPGAAVMSGNASASTGPQAATMTPVFVTVNKKSDGSTLKTTVHLPVLPAGRMALACHALNVWTNCGGAGTAATRAQKILAAQGLTVQET